MRFEVDYSIDIDIEGVSEKVTEAARLAMRDTVVDVHRDTMFNMEKLGIVKTGNNKRSVAGEVSGMGCVATGGSGSAENVVDSSKIEGAVYSTSGYGGYLETGTIYMTPRPTFYPAMTRDFTAEKFAERVKRHLK